MRRDSRRARLIGLLTALGGVIVLLSTLPGVGGRFGGVVDIVAPVGVRVTSHVIASLEGGGWHGYLLLAFSARRLLSTCFVIAITSQRSTPSSWWCSY